MCYNTIEKGEVIMNYTYDQETMKKRVFSFIYGCAMHDAILQNIL